MLVYLEECLIEQQADVNMMTKGVQIKLFNILTEKVTFFVKLLTWSLILYIILTWSIILYFFEHI